MSIVGAEYLFPVSYKGAFWHAYSYSTNGGTEVAIHKIVNSSKQTIDELGTKLKEFTVKGCIVPFETQGTGEPPQYISQRDYVLSSLDSPGKGVLVHPTFGALTDIKAISWSLDESDESIGKGSLTVQFRVSNFDGVIKRDVEEASTINAIQREANSNVLSDMSNEIDADTGLLGNYAAIKEKAQQVGDKIESANEAIQIIQGDIDAVTAEIAEFQNDVATLAAFPQKYAASVTNIFATINGSVATAVTGVEAFKTFFGFGFLTDINLTFGTNAAKAINKNTSVVNTSINALALTSVYQHSANLDFKTVDEVNELESLLDDQFNLIMENGDKDLSVIKTLLDGRDRIRSLFESRRLTAARVIEVISPITSARTLSYRYYGSDSEANAISDLNNSYGIAMSGKIKVFTS